MSYRRFLCCLTIVFASSTLFLSTDRSLAVESDCQQSPSKISQQIDREKGKPIVKKRNFSDKIGKQTGSAIAKKNFFNRCKASLLKLHKPVSLPVAISHGECFAIETPFSQQPIDNIAPNTGSPSLRLRPFEQEEQKFEPTRIPLRLPKFDFYRASPSATIVNPSAYGASWRTAGVGFGLQERTRFTSDADGVIGLGFGLGNPNTNVGVQLGVTLVDVSAPFRDGAFNVKLHRRLPSDFSVALGVQGLANWGDTDGGSSGYGVVTKKFTLKEDRTQPFSELYTSIGLGGGQFRSESDIRNGNDSLGVFSSLALRVIEPMSLVTEWTGQDLTIGLSVVPFRNLPLVIVPAVTDITGEAGDGARFIFGFGYGFTF
ncbi:MAG: hypothetical protein ACRC2R_06685 [Xenococcaceae cyanobacterium]